MENETNVFPAESNVPEAPAVPVKAKPKMGVLFIIQVIICIIGIILGLVFVIISLSSYVTVHDSSASSVTFGADFYTEIYKAARYAANNTAESVRLLKCIMNLVRVIEITAGACLSLGSGYKLCELIRSRKKANS